MRGGELPPHSARQLYLQKHCTEPSRTHCHQKCSLLATNLSYLLHSPVNHGALFSAHRTLCFLSTAIPHLTEKQGKIKVQLKLAISRLRMVQQKDEAIAKQQRRAMAQLLEVRPLPLFNLPSKLPQSVPALSRPLFHSPPHRSIQPS